MRNSRQQVLYGCKHTTEELKVVKERPLACIRHVLADGAAQEENQNNRCGDPERSIQIRVALEDIEEVGPGEKSSPAAGQDSGCIDVEELRVEVHAPKEALR